MRSYKNILETIVIIQNILTILFMQIMRAKKKLDLEEEEREFQEAP